MEQFRSCHRHYVNLFLKKRWTNHCGPWVGLAGEGLFTRQHGVQLDPGQEMYQNWGQCQSQFCCFLFLHVPVEPHKQNPQTTQQSVLPNVFLASF